MIYIPFVDAPKQTVSLVLAGRRCTFTFVWNKMLDRWSMDLSIDSFLKVSGRRLVPANDLISQFELEIGVLACVDYAATGEPPGYDAFVAGRHRLFHVPPEEVPA